MTRRKLTRRTPKNKGREKLPKLPAPVVYSDSDAVKARALVAYAEHGTVKEACQAAGISRSTWYDWRKVDADFARAVEAAEEEAVETLEAEAAKRAKDKSDLLLMFLLKAKKPDMYREGQRLTVVSPEVRDRLKRTLGVIRDHVPESVRELVIEKLSEVWS